MPTDNIPESFDAGFTPQKPQGAFRSGLDTIPDGDYDWTILSADFRITPKTNDNIFSLEIRCEKNGSVVEKPYFLKTQQNADVLGGDLGTLGYDVDNWTAANKRTFSGELKAVIATVGGRRFKGTKKTNKDGYHNLYVNARLPDAKPGTVPFTGSNGPLASPAARAPAVDESEVPF